MEIIIIIAGAVLFVGLIIAPYVLSSKGGFHGLFSTILRWYFVSSDDEPSIVKSEEEKEETNSLSELPPSPRRISSCESNQQVRPTEGPSSSSPSDESYEFVESVEAYTDSRHHEDSSVLRSTLGRLSASSTSAASKLRECFVRPSTPSPTTPQEETTTTRERPEGEGREEGEDFSPEKSREHLFRDVGKENIVPSIESNDEDTSEEEKIPEKDTTYDDEEELDEDELEEICRRREESGADEIENKDDSDEIGSTTSERIPSVEQAQMLKGKGNEAFSSGEYLDALALYSQGLTQCPQGEATLLSILLANRSACHLQLNSLEEAVVDATDAIDLNPSYVKGYLRRFKAYEDMEKWHDALSDINKAIELDPSISATYSARQKRAEFRSKQKFEEEKEEMIGKLKDLGNWALGKVGLSLDNFKVEQNPDTGSYNISFQQQQQQQAGTTDNI